MIKLPEPVVPEGDWLVRDQYIREYAAKAVRDFGEHLAKHFGSMPGREMFGGEIEDEIRALIKEIK